MYTHIYALQLHTDTYKLTHIHTNTQVKGLEFNTFSPNLLATGAADSDLCIWDLVKPSTPSLYPALKVGSGPCAGLTFHCKLQRLAHLPIHVQ